MVDMKEVDNNIRLVSKSMTEAYMEDVLNTIPESEREPMKQQLNTATKVSSENIEKSLSKLNKPTGFFTHKFDKNKAKVGIIKGNHNIEWRVVKIKNKFFTIKTDRYIVMFDNFLFDKGKPVLLYYDKNPFPLKFSHDTNLPIVDTASLNAIWQTNIIQGLFDVGGLSTATKITVGIIMATAIGLVIIFGGVFPSDEAVAPIGLFMLNKWVKK